MHHETDCFGRSLAPLRNKKLFLLDMDGTLYKDGVLFPYTLDFLQALRDSKTRFCFVTNNTSRSTEAYIEKLAGLGIPATVDDFASASIATQYYLKTHHPGELVYCLGTKSLVEELSQSGIRVTTSLSPDIGLALLSYDNELTYQKLTDLCQLLTERGEDFPYLATNCDFCYPCSFGFLPDCGSFAQMIEHACKRLPRFLGKPDPLMIELALAQHACCAEDACVIGDRLYTDIAVGKNAGVTSICVLSGEANLEEVKALPIEEQPDFCLEHVGQLTALLCPVAGAC